MADVQTTAGPVEDGKLGLTLIHEHLRVRSEAVSFQFPHLYDEADEHERAVKQVRAAMERGVKTICDPTVCPARGLDRHLCIPLRATALPEPRRRLDGRRVRPRHRGGHPGC